MAASVSHAQLGDHFEQYAWAHSLEWGYYKHPPVPTWLLSGLIHVFGPSIWLTYVLSALFNAGTAIFTFLIARKLFGTPTAALAVLLWGLDFKYSFRAEWWNHNTTMIFFVAMTVWLVMRAVLRKNLGWWLAAGIAAGLSLLSKYQAVIPLFGIIFSLWHSSALRKPEHRRGLALAATTAALVFLPHLLWAVAHDFSTLKYASQENVHPGLLARLRSMLSFSLIQVRMLFPAIVCMALAALWLRYRPQAPLTANSENPSENPLLPRQSWLFGLFLIPLAAVMSTALLVGLELHDHWGFQTMQFFPLILGWRFRKLLRIGLARWFGLVLVTHSMSMLVYAQATLHPHGGGRHDPSYPAREIAQAVVRDWHSITNCPLRYVVGPSFEAGMISIYSGQFPAVLENNQPALSPWIDMHQLQQAGAVYVEIEAPTHAVKHTSFPFELPGSDEKRNLVMHWSIVAPEACDPTATPPTLN
ncbi:MAG: glycosyltransferase family 39 protein [Leptothrix sp. (in: b-proteobacteria)]